jgi:hypothetical protein
MRCAIAIYELISLLRYGQHSRFDAVPDLRRHAQGGFFAANHEFVGVEVVLERSFFWMSFRAVAIVFIGFSG